jgi:hypothetical protein
MERADLMASIEEPVGEPDPRKDEEAEPVKAAIWEVSEGLPRFSQASVIKRVGVFVRLEAIRTEKHQTRAFMYETDKGAYLPAEDVARAMIEGLGYKGYVSMELFSRTMAEEGDSVPEEHAKRGMKAWKKFVHRLNLQ